MNLPEDFKEFIELMNSHSVRYVMIGGFAYNLYRNPRATGDIDFFVASNEANELRIRQVLTEFGFGGTFGSSPLLQPGKVIMLGKSPFRIDILTEISAVSFAEAESTAQVMQISGIEIAVISPELLL
ncbi:MAG: nucleotidyl transferase AbiEii/AbiGii toxin family protein, partial [Pirellulaceae bacterium]